MIGLMAALSSRMTETQVETMAGDMTPRTVSETPHTEKPAPDSKNTPAYWMDRGGLLAAYGNYTAAARCYQKAIDLAPDRAEAYFQLGVAYGEMGRLEAAVKAISQAIDRDPANGAYFYGRGRVYLLAGEENLAMKDFMEAGFLGNKDARNYLKHAGVDWS